MVFLWFSYVSAGFPHLVGDPWDPAQPIAVALPALMANKAAAEGSGSWRDQEEQP